MAESPPSVIRPSAILQLDFDPERRCKALPRQMIVTLFLVLAMHWSQSGRVRDRIESSPSQDKNLIQNGNLGQDTTVAPKSWTRSYWGKLKSKFIYPIEGFGCMVRDRKRFADTGGWEWAQFDYNPASATFTPNTSLRRQMRVRGPYDSEGERLCFHGVPDAVNEP